MGTILCYKQFQTAPQRVPTFYQFTSNDASKPLKPSIKADILQKCINLNKIFHLTECMFFFDNVFRSVVVPLKVTWQTNQSNK